jgi:ribose transport system substrate-binding protein
MFLQQTLVSPWLRLESRLAIAAKNLTGKVVLVGTDGIPQAKKEIQAGTMTATVSEQPVTEGASGVDATLWLMAGKKVPGWIDVPAFIIDSELA